MKLVIQRVKEASVRVNDDVTGAIRTGLLVFVGIARTDTREDADYLVDKLIGLRVFPDENGKMNRNVVEARGSVLVISQFTLYGDCRRGKPRTTPRKAAEPDSPTPSPSRRNPPGAPPGRGGHCAGWRPPRR